jgi:hypothetical protein
MSPYIPPLSPFVFLAEYTINISSIQWVRWNVIQSETKAGSSTEVSWRRTYIQCQGSLEPIVLDASSYASSLEYEEDLERLENVLRAIEFSKLNDKHV